jgi:hypothetical protein
MAAINSHEGVSRWSARKTGAIIAVERRPQPCGARGDRFRAFYPDVGLACLSRRYATGDETRPRNQARRSRHRPEILWRSALASAVGKGYIGIMLISLLTFLGNSCDHAR